MFGSERGVSKREEDSVRDYINSNHRETVLCLLAWCAQKKSDRDRTHINGYEDNCGIINRYENHRSWGEGRVTLTKAKDVREGTSRYTEVMVLITYSGSVAGYIILKIVDGEVKSMNPAKIEQTLTKIYSRSVW